MRQSPSESVAWYNALTLDERRDVYHRLLKPSKENFPIDSKKGEGRLKKWRQQAPFQEDHTFSQRLSLDNLSEEEFKILLSIPAEHFSERLPSPPAWLDDLKNAFAWLKESQTISPGLLAKNPTAGFLYLVEPIVRYFDNLLQSDLEKLESPNPELTSDPVKISRMLIDSLVEKFTTIIEKTMILELNAARLDGKLQGTDSRERFYDFIEKLRDKDFALAIFREYPVLARFLIEYSRIWHRSSLEFYRHLCQDREAIVQKFSSNKDPGNVTEIRVGAGDSHRGGRTVNIVTFQSGLKLVYKPRTLSFDRHFQELLVWLNKKGAEPFFKTLDILDCSDHGWVEFVKFSSCLSPGEVECFYRRLGGYLAVLYALKATDFHYENLIASGQHPFLIDLESFFTPQAYVKEEGLSYDVASEMFDSVLMTSLLPRRLHLHQRDDGVDLSGMSQVKGKYTPIDVFSWEREGTDEMRGVFKRLPLKEGKNRPQLNGVEVNLFDYSDMFVQGFTDIYTLLVQHRQELLDENGILAKCADDEIRVIFRMTLTYNYLMNQGTHPDKLRDALEQERHLDGLWMGVPEEISIYRLIPGERRALWCRDIPLFTTKPSSYHLWWDQEKKIDNFFKKNGLTRVKEGLAELSPEDCQKQIWLIRASLAAMETENVRKPNYIIHESGKEVSKERLLTAAKAVGDRLEATALRQEGKANWIGLRATREDYYDLSPLGIDLYTGLPGQALFLAYLGAVTREDKYTHLAREALNTITSDLPLILPRIEEIGVFGGLGSIIYLYSHLGYLWDEPGLFTKAEALISGLMPLIDSDVNYDLVSGAAGCIAGLLVLYRCHPSQCVLSAAIQCGEHLIKNAKPMKQGLGWKTPYSPPLTGFSHGSAGIGWALLELSTLTGKKHFRETAQQALVYERLLFLPEIENWADRRHFVQEMEKQSSTRVSTVTWCHGAPGIGMSRLRMQQLLDDPEMEEEINVALKTTTASGFGMNHCLCHGDLGNLELFLQASLNLNQSEWNTKVNRLATGILDSIDKYGWICGVAAGTETPGLMTGITGIGYGCLRLAEPQQVPSVLLLEPPIQ
jgi:type 2 lantibiotic biosynthesis protein LanM